MILIITTLVITLFVIISIYYINNIQKKAQIITTKQLEHMSGLYTDDGSNLHLLLSEDYKKQFIKDGIKNFNQTKIIENGVIKLKNSTKTDYEKIRHKTDDGMLDKFFKEISKALLPYTTTLKGENIETIKLNDLEKLLQLILDGKKKLNNTTTTATNVITTTGSNVVEPFLSDVALKDKLKNEKNKVIKPPKISFEFEELDVQKMTTSIFNEMKKESNKDSNKENNNVVTTTKDNYIHVDKDKIIDYLRSLEDIDIYTNVNAPSQTDNNKVTTTSHQQNTTSQQKDTKNVELFTSSTETNTNDPYEFKYDEKNKKEKWKIEKPDTFEYIDDPSYPDPDDEEYYKRNTEEYNKEQQDHYDRITLLNNIEVSKQKWLYSNSCKKMLEHPFMEEFKKAYHNYMVYAFTHVLKYLPAIEKPTQLTVIELKAYNQILKKMPKCDDLMSLFSADIDKLNCGNTNNNNTNNTNGTTTIANVKKYKIELDKNKPFLNNNFNNINDNMLDIKNKSIPVNDKIKKLIRPIIDNTISTTGTATATSRATAQATAQATATTTKYVQPKAKSPWASYSLVKAAYSALDYFKEPEKNTTTKENISTTTTKQDVSTTKDSCVCPTKENITTNGNVTTTKENITTNGNVTTTKENIPTTTKNIVTTTLGNVITTTIGNDKDSKYAKELELLGLKDFQPYDPSNPQCPVTFTLKNMKPLKY